VFSPGAGIPAYRFLVVGMVCQLAGDTWYTISSLQGTFSFGTWFFVSWLVFYVCLGTAALHPSMRQLSEPAPDHEAVLTGRRLGFLAAAALISPAVLVVIDADRNDEYVLAATSALLFLLVLARMRGLLVYIAEHERMKRLKDEFTSVVSHELRTPLTSIRGALGLVAGGALGPIPDKAQRMLDIASENTERLVRLINDILDIERMESGQITLEKKRCRAADLVGRATDAMRAMADEAGVTLTLEAGDAHLSADDDRMMQTLTNLLSNAVKFSPRGGNVRLTAQRRGEHVVFSVEDEGRGIPPEHIERIFAPFQQVDSSDSRDKGGTGLGLAICRSIVTQHGGRIWAESTPGHGAKLSFSVPALDDATRSEPPVMAGPLVLVCDDDPSVREVVTAILERRAYRVVTASSAEEAVEVAAVQQPAAILLDLLMPGISGWDAAALLKQHSDTRHIPIVILSVLSQREADEVTGNVVDWVQKPLDEPTLFGALEKAVTGSHKPSRVLIVEDDLDLAHVLTAMLERNGVEVLHAADGGEAIRVSQRFVPDLVVLDLELPGVDGFAVVEWMRRHDRLRHAPLVVYTGAELDHEDRERLRLGHTEFLTKGCVAPDDFDGRVTDLLDKLAGVGDTADDRSMADDAA
jgi:signal transduction histidine kinase/CheY-like chemotaxis protein